MLLTDEQVAEFQNIYRQKFGVEISREEAFEKGTKLIQLLRIIYKTPNEKKYNCLQKKERDDVKIS